MSALEAVMESVPNFSEGRDRAIVDALADAIRSVPGVALLDSTMDADHNRSVLTFAGRPDAVAEASFLAAAVAVENIDLRKHSGVHPRIGALDVLPFVPVAGITIDECAACVTAVAQRIWDSLRVPAYLYESAARRAALRDLSALRRAAGHEPPDIGGPDLHPSAGAIAAGARPFLIAFNVDLDTSDVSAARTIARLVRASSGGLPAVKALGLYLPSRGVPQVSMNLVDFERTPIHVAYEAVCREAERLGIVVSGTEFIGLVPRRAYEVSVGRVPGLEESLVFESRLGASLLR
jgi:glutamate formiminotransferase